MSQESGPPPGLVRSLVDGPSVFVGLEWHDEVTSTNALAADAARQGVPEVHAILADVQTAGRGRLGRGWAAPAGTSLMGSYLLRPGVDASLLPLLPLLIGLTLADAVSPHVPEAEVALKWPNDLLVGGRKSAGILLETVAGAVVAGVGLNVDWRGVSRPPELATATSLAEVAGRDVDRWRVLAAFAGVFSNRYRQWLTDPRSFLPDYRARCLTIGQHVRVARLDRPPVDGHATGVTEDGALTVQPRDTAAVTLSAGDVEHVRPV